MNRKVLKQSYYNIKVLIKMGYRNFKPKNRKKFRTDTNEKQSGQTKMA